ncbi:MAG: hypothetical protein KC478_00870 [Bacteriovoracaceae bacterium]|nr:hypothetical protein [Bacteriovoracaceae bacterium]
MNKKQNTKFFTARVMADTNLYIVELGSNEFTYGKEVIVKTEFGNDLAYITSFPFDTAEEVKGHLSGPMLRYANDSDKEAAKVSGQKSITVKKEITKLAQELNLEMNITHILCPLEGKTIAVYYTAKGRVDFRELLKQLRSLRKEKIIMRQIGTKERFDSFAMDARTPINLYRSKQ